MKTLLVGLVAVGLGFAAVGCGAGTDASASSTADVTTQHSLLALGDSVAFAWNPNTPLVDGKVVASNYHGYADILGQRMGLAVVNSACPGEASGSFLDKNAPDNGCRANRAAYKLHADWGNVDTQMQFAVNDLKAAIANGTPPDFITLSMGGNDLLLMQKDCKAWGVATAPCELVKLPFAKGDYGSHLKTILQTINDTGYRGTMVIVTTHAPDYSDMIANLALGQFNGEIAKIVDDVKGHVQMTVKVADAFAAFKVEADKHGGKTCETGLLVKNPDGTCDIHPSEAGHEVIANAIQAALTE